MRHYHHLGLILSKIHMKKRKRYLNGILWKHICCNIQCLWNYIEAKNKNTPVSGNAGDKKNLHLGGCKFIFVTFLLFFFFSLYLKNYWNNNFLCWKTRSPTFYCSKKKKNQFIPINLLVANRLNYEFQVFINHDFLRTRFRACKIVLGARPCTWEIVHIKADVHVTDNNIIQR